MRRIMIFCVVTVASLVASIATHAQPPGGEVHLGLQAAITSCGSCHQVAPTIPSPIDAAPSFQDIANLPSTTAISLRAFLHSNHNKMPNFILSHADADELIAYILGLKRR